MPRRLRNRWGGLSRGGKLGLLVWALVVLTIVGASLSRTDPGKPLSTGGDSSVAPEASEGGGPSATPDGSAGAGPSVAPSGNDGTVAAVGNTIPGLTAAGITVHMEGQGLTCSGPEPFLDGVSYECSGTSQDGSIELHVRFIGDDPSAIRSLEATTLGSGGEASEEAVGQFLGYVATLPYEGAQPEVARSWVEAAVGGSMAFGQARYHVGSADAGAAPSLTITGGYPPIKSAG